MTMISSTPLHDSLSNNIVVSPIWIGWRVLKPKHNLAILMLDQRRRSSLQGSISCRRRCIDSTTLDGFFMVISSIKPLCRLTGPPSNFTPNDGLPNVQRKQPLMLLIAITQKPKYLSLANIHFKTQSWPDLSNDVKQRPQQVALLHFSGQHNVCLRCIALLPTHKGTQPIQK